MRLHVVVQRVADLRGRDACPAGRAARPAPRRARRRRCGRRRCWRRARRGSAWRRRFPAPPGRTDRWPGAASRRTGAPSYSSRRAQRVIEAADGWNLVRRRDSPPLREGVGGGASRASSPRPLPRGEWEFLPVSLSSAAQHRPGRHRMAAQERVRRHRRAAGQLDPRQPQRAAAAGDGQPLVQHRAGRARPDRPAATASTFSTAPRSVVNVPGQGSNARTCRSIAAASRVQSIRPASRVSFGA